jgi:hypothetical protein
MFDKDFERAIRAPPLGLLSNDEIAREAQECLKRGHAFISTVSLLDGEGSSSSGSSRLAAASSLALFKA